MSAPGVNDPAESSGPWQRRITLAAKRYQALRRRATASRWLVPVIALLLVVGIVVSWVTLDVDLGAVDRWRLLASAALAVPAAILSATEYWLAQRLVGGRASARESVTVSLLGSLGNLLPLPGGAIVRVDAMTSGGSALSAAVRTTAGIGLVWVGMALVASGVAIVSLGSSAAGAALVGIGVVIAIGGVVAIGPRGSRTRWLTSLVFVVEALVIAIAAWRILLVLEAIGESATATQALGLVASGAVAVSVGLVPAGLGVRELLAGLLAPLVGLPAAAGFLTAGLNQILSLLGQGALAAVVRPGRG